MLDVTYCHTAVALVVDEHRQSASVVCALLRTCKHEVDVGVAIGDETLHTVQSPALVLLVIASLEHHALKVGTGIRLGKVHGHGLAGAYTWNVLLALLLGAKLIEGLYTVLQAPDVLEAGIGSSNNLRSHGVGSDRHVQATIAARHGHTPKASLACGIEVVEGLGSIYHASVNEVRTLKVNVLSVRLKDIGGDVASNLEQLLVVLYCVIEVNGSVCILSLVGKAALFQFNDALHLRMVEVELKLGMVGIIVCHNLKASPPAPLQGERGDNMLCTLGFISWMESVFFSLNSRVGEGLGVNFVLFVIQSVFYLFHYLINIVGYLLVFEP